MTCIEQISQSDNALKLAGWALFHYVSFYFFCRRMTDTDEYRHRNPFVFAGLMSVLPVMFLSLYLNGSCWAPETKILYAISFAGNFPFWGFWFLHPTHPPRRGGSPIPMIMSLPVLGAVLSCIWVVVSIKSPELRLMPNDVEKNWSIYKVLVWITLVLMFAFLAYATFKGWQRSQ